MLNTPQSPQSAAVPGFRSCPPLSYRTRPVLLHFLETTLSNVLMYSDAVRSHEKSALMPLRR